MGLFRRSSSSRLGYRVDPTQPDLSRWHILRHEYIGSKGYLVLEVLYPNCTNFEGRKIILYSAGVTLEELIQQKELDPHFTHKSALSPIARFIPTKAGWDMAIKMAEAL